FTSGGPPRKIVPVPFTITASSDIAGTYAPPAVHEPITAAICASLHRGVVGDDQALAPLHAPDAGDDPGRGRAPLVLVHAVRGERGELEEGGAGIDKRVDALAHRHLPLLPVPLQVLLPAALPGVGEALVQVVDELLEPVAVRVEFVGCSVEMGLEWFHVAISSQGRAGVLAGWPGGVPAALRRRRDGAGPAVETTARPSHSDCRRSASNINSVCDSASACRDSSLSTRTVVGSSPSRRRSSSSNDSAMRSTRPASIASLAVS